MLRCDAGLRGLATDRRAGRRGRPRHVLALVAGVALALSVGAVTATSASALSWVTRCTITVHNNTPDPMEFYSYSVNGVMTNSWNPWLRGGDSAEFDAASTEPFQNHCTINFWWQLATTPNDTAWSPALQTYVYDPNSGRNSASSSVSGDFAVRTTVVANPQDHGSLETMDVTVSPKPSAAFRSSAAGLRAGTDPLRRVPDAAAGLGEPKQVPSLLQRGDLIGRGWRRVTRIGDLGRLGSILAATKVAASCQDKNSKASEPSPLKEGLSAFALRSGAEFIGAGQAIYANAGQARRTIDDAVSVHSIGCLARLLTSQRFHTSVNTQRRSVTFAGRQFILNRLKVSTRSGAGITGTDYIDVIGVLHGNANALLMFASNKQPPEVRGEVAAVKAVAGRLR
jgi:hypothetical protein